MDTEKQKTCERTTFKTVAELLRREILKGNPAPGERLESVRALSERFNVGRQVVLSAFQMLASEHLIQSEVGRGSFVNPALSALKNCTLAYAVIRDDLKNKFYDSIYKGMCRGLNPSKQKLLLFEQVLPENIKDVAEKCDCMILTGQLNNATVRAAQAAGKKFLTVGNYLLRDCTNNIHFQNARQLEKILESAPGHDKSIGVILGGIQLPSTRALVDAAERYSAEHDLPWGVDNVICANSEYATDEIRAAWGTKHSWPNRLVMTLHSYLGFAQFLLEERVPEREWPEILVMLTDTSFLPLPYMQFHPVACPTNDAECGRLIPDLAAKLCAGRIEDNFSADYDPVTETIRIKHALNSDIH